MPPRRAPAAAARAPANKGLTKSQFVSELATATSMTKVQVTAALAAISTIVGRELKRGNPVTIPGLVKVSLTHKPATAAHPGKNPFTGEAITVKAKPARKVVKVKAVKALKDLA